MRLSPELWLEGPYYIDYDRLGQLRIAGPGNHQHYGSTGLTRKELPVSRVWTDEGRVFVECILQPGIEFLDDPALGHVRRVRDSVLHHRRGTRTFKQAARELAPSSIGLENLTDSGETAMVFKRFYGRQWYGVRISLPKGVKASRHPRRRGFILERGSKPLKIRLEPITSLEAKPGINRIFSPGHKLPQDKETEAVWERTAGEVKHMLRYGKTSGFDFGTIFPRDWMETADLGQGDLLPSAQAYMYARSLEHVGGRGLGWHEDIIGEYLEEEEAVIEQARSELDELVGRASAAKQRLDRIVSRARDVFVNRNMIDIEPHYLMGLDRLAERLSSQDIKRLRYVAAFVMRQARENELITFKRVPDLLRRHKHDLLYYRAGNWRDSDDAFLMIHPVVAPYDVNAVFYPAALEAIARHHRLLGADKTEAELLAAKWSGAKERFRFVNPDGQGAFAIALYDVRQSKDDLLYRKLEVNHTDEAYDLFYREPDELDVASFARRLLDPKYFYTPSGPMVVGKGQGYTTKQYHGEVIWLKASAFAVAGLARQLERGKRLGWQEETLKLIRKAAVTVAETSLNASRQLDMVPELYIDKRGKAARFDLQPGVGWPMNQVQLWSAVGIRRIIREYLRLLASG